MFTIYDPTTEAKRLTVTGRTREIAYAKADRLCDKLGSGALVFDDTCAHGTAYAICRICEG